MNTETTGRIRARVYETRGGGYRWEVGTDLATLREGRAATEREAAAAADAALRAARRLEGGMR